MTWKVSNRKGPDMVALLLAVVYAGLGEKDQAFDSLEKANQERSTLLVYLEMDPRLDNLRSDPRFGTLLRRMSFPI